VKEDGGTAETIVSEENGILISMMLRQYFMALRTIGQWQHLSDHWRAVAHKCNAAADTSTAPRSDQESSFKPEADSSHTWTKFMQTRLGLHTKPLNDNADSDDEQNHASQAEIDTHERVEDELWLMRKYFGRWAAKIGAKSHACDEMSSEHFVDWTQAIAPKLEGRIQMVE